MRSKLDLRLKASKLAGLLKGDRMGPIQNVITSLSEVSKDMSGTSKITIISLKCLESLNMAQASSNTLLSQCHYQSILDMFRINKINTGLDYFLVNIDEDLLKPRL